ncbi:hypothetical protein RUMCAL_02554 [Ruminococcus callidus ATCC 27760]|uniref:Uncharacterized protein n=1 Tax=Ruminococcus callidus ATCC 27760 TaxID=411473 RepID=U2KHH0_9FIRM|nr:hypothetical protein RUMCAL_02554 [Ruminococcus callidus ATCC 27760]
MSSLFFKFFRFFLISLRVPKSHAISGLFFYLHKYLHKMINCDIIEKHYSESNSGIICRGNHNGTLFG